MGCAGPVLWRELRRRQGEAQGIDPPETPPPVAREESAGRSSTAWRCLRGTRCSSRASPAPGRKRAVGMRALDLASDPAVACIRHGLPQIGLHAVRIGCVRDGRRWVARSATPCSPSASAPISPSRRRQSGPQRQPMFARPAPGAASQPSISAAVGVDRCCHPSMCLAATGFHGRLPGLLQDHVGGHSGTTASPSAPYSAAAFSGARAKPLSEAMPSSASPADTRRTRELAPPHPVPALMLVGYLRRPPLTAKGLVSTTSIRSIALRGSVRRSRPQAQSSPVGAGGDGGP